MHIFLKCLLFTAAHLSAGELEACEWKNIKINTFSVILYLLKLKKKSAVYT